MKTFNEYVDDIELMNENLQMINEALVEFGSKRETQFGNVVIMAGGAGSGKSFVLNNLLGVQGKVLDVDALKAAALKSKKIKEVVKKELGYDLDNFNLKNTEDVSKLHMIIADHLNLSNRANNALFASILSSHPDRKPNIVFDTTLKDLQKLQQISTQVTELGYDKKKIHIVWVVNDIEVAKAQNAKRSRTVKEEILVNTHRGVSQTMQDIVNAGDKLKSYMDGYIYFVFNKAGIDSSVTKSDSGGMVIDKANYVAIKKPGKQSLSVSQISDEILKKIKAYTPKMNTWDK